MPEREDGWGFLLLTVGSSVGFSVGMSGAGCRPMSLPS